MIRACLTLALIVLVVVLLHVARDPAGANDCSFAASNGNAVPADCGGTP